jgi:hypothetical protein
MDEESKLDKKIAEARLMASQLKALAVDAPAYTPQAAAFNIAFPDQLKIAINMIESAIAAAYSAKAGRVRELWQNQPRSASAMLEAKNDALKKVRLDMEERLKKIQDTLRLAGLDAASVQKWILLYGHKVRLKILTRISKVLQNHVSAIRAAFAGVTTTTATIRVKYRGSLVRGLKTYHKGTLDQARSFDPQKFDCDAYIEVPSDLWQKMKAELKRYGYNQVDDHKREKQLDQLKKMRDYEPLDYIAVPAGPEMESWRKVVAKLKDEEGKIAQELAQIEGYQTIVPDEGNKAVKAADFEFYLRPDTNSVDLYRLGNPYLVKQISGLGPGYSLLERELPYRKEDEFEKKRNTIKHFPQLDDYVDVYGAKSCVMPEYQVVVSDNGWYFEDEDLFNDWMSSSQGQPEVGVKVRS